MADYLGEEIPEEEDEPEPMGDLGMLADLGLSDFDLGAIIDDLDLGSDEMLMAIADKIKLNPQFRKVAEAALQRLSPRSWPASGTARCGWPWSRPGWPPTTATCRSARWSSTRPARWSRRPATSASWPATRRRTPRSWCCARRPGVLGSWRLTGHTLVVTLEPCTMCAGALVLARVARLVFGAYDPKAGAVASLFDVVRDPRLNHRVDVRGGILEAECGGAAVGLLRRPLRSEGRSSEARPDTWRAKCST